MYIQTIDVRFTNSTSSVLWAADVICGSTPATFSKLGTKTKLEQTDLGQLEDAIDEARMYFDGQLHYRDKERQSAMPPKPQHQLASTADAIPAPQPPVSSSTSTPSMPKSQTSSSAAGDLHSMAMKSAINNIGWFLCCCLTISAALCQKTVLAETDALCCVAERTLTDYT